MASASPTSARRVVQLGEFELDRATGELRKGEAKHRLQEQPLKILELLLEQPGELVSREQIQQRLWPDGTFVEFEHSVNAAVKRLREALGDSVDNPKFIETIPRRGYRLIVPVKKPEPSADVAPALAILRKATRRIAAAAGLAVIRTDLQRLKRDTESTGIVATQASTGQTLKRRKRWVVLVACTAAIGLAAGDAWYLRSGRAHIDSIAVLPFTNVSGDANSDYLSDGITESLIANLTHVPQLKVKSRHSVFRYKGKDVEVQKFGNDLGVSALVSGRVVRRGDSIEVSAELTDVRDNTEIWGQHYSGKSADIISLQQQIAGDLAKKLSSKLSISEKQQVTKQGTQNPEAYELYLRGRYSWNKRTDADLEAAISYFNQAIAKDPGYALAYSGLADAYAVLLDDFQKSNAAARRALELDTTLARPHAVLALTEMKVFDFAGGEAEFKKAFELDPNDATAHQWYAFSIGHIGDREVEALAEANRAHQLDPLSPSITTGVGLTHILARRYDQAIAICEKLAKEDPTFALTHLCLANAYWGKGMYPQVIEELKAYGQLSKDRDKSERYSAMAQGFRSAGWKGALRKLIEIRQVQRKSSYGSAYYIGALYADLGEKDQAFRWLNTAYQERAWELMGLKTDFVFDPLRSDPRFAELVRKVGLPQ